MPRLPIDYSKTIIYKICCKDINITDIYVGHTTDLTRRRRQHKHSCNNENNKNYNMNVYQFIRNNGSWDNWSVIPIEEYPCENVNQAHIRERYWIEELKASLNRCIPLRTHKEWCEYKNEKFTCECGGKYTYCHTSRHLKSKIHQDFLTQTIST